MSKINQLEMECNKCRVVSTCPKAGVSPLQVGKTSVKCRLIGGYGRKPVDVHILSNETKKIMERDGPCLTLAEVPVSDDGEIKFDTVMIFSSAVLSPREVTMIPHDSVLYPRSHNH